MILPACAAARRAANHMGVGSAARTMVPHVSLFCYQCILIMSEQGWWTLPTPKVKRSGGCLVTTSDGKASLVCSDSVPVPQVTTEVGTNRPSSHHNKYPQLTGKQQLEKLEFLQQNLTSQFLYTTSENETTSASNPVAHGVRRAVSQQ